jgi:hypothetical protein
VCAATTAAGGVTQDLLESPHLTLELQGLLEQLPKQMDKVEGGGGDGQASSPPFGWCCVHRHS